MIDLAIIGGGPAALSAAIYAGRAGLETKVFERGKIGGALTEISKISNYPGYVGSGEGLAEILRKQAEEAGAKVEYGECTEVRKEGDEFILTIDEEEVRARAVLMATGSEPKPLEFALETPVSYCALCDGDLVRGNSVAVVGGGNSAIQEALYLAEIAKKVTVISHSPLKAMAALAERARAAKNIEIREGEEVTKELLEGYERVFVYIGKRPATRCVAGLGVTDADGYIETVRGHETKVAGLFVAGDARVGATRQAITAAGDGAEAAVEIISMLR